MEFLKTEQAAFYPKQCICGNQHGPFADTGIERPLGLPVGQENATASPVVHVYLCERCIRTAGHLFKMVEEETHEKLRGQYADLLLTVDQLETEIDSVRPVIEAAREHVAGTR